ncbi:hypothetical protein ATE92_2559 [Ulvibacter sp. MAR_2010_11]|uniref:phosphoesterase n=1 Tax=Ulvibacter sp. MAR_2010_11 TaxID=1250229 RepID=UPI000CC184C4|nr:phosphoesterase [Ulvibacter sp. MAR_2010_11]PKA84371.1 hypothetical protein ATE92_2559 [Ulvibacter sp. MAR_2010_11]
MMIRYFFCVIVLVFTLVSCATRNIQLASTSGTEEGPAPNLNSERFYLLGNTHGNTRVLKAMETMIVEDSTKNKHLILLGDNVKAKDEKILKQQLDKSIEVVKSTKTTPYFISGNYEWAFDGIKGLETIENHLEENMKEDDFMIPKNGCPLESVEISKEIQLIILDSQWYLEDWDKHPKINDKCEIKTRKLFLLELEGELKKYANKTVLLAMHHPMYTNGPHGGRFGLREHIFPVPGIGSLVAEIRSQGAISVQDRFNSRYNELMQELQLLIENDENRIVLISAHEKSLQYIENGQIKQIISGGGSKIGIASIGADGQFSYGKNGFSVVDANKDGSVWVTFYGMDASNTTRSLFRKEIYKPIVKPVLDSLPDSFPETMQASVYEIDKVEKSDFFKSFWGNHYRDVYGTKVTAKTANLNTLYGGLEVVRPGGGHQTKSLRLISKDGKEYNMRALKKSAVQFLETTSFKGTDGEKYLSNTIPEDFILDFYTAAHPYAAFAIPKISRAANVLYTTPELYYVPRQKALGKYNEEYGDQLYMIVEKPTEEFKNLRNFGYPDDIESTDDMLLALRKDEDFIMDEEAYIRARVFDMLIGDWDRHSDQWRWAAFENDNGKKVFVPIPRDRDQVFANFDGSFLNIMKNIVGAVNQFGVYGEDIYDVKWFNKAGMKLDRALIKRSDKTVWLEQALFLQRAIDQNILDEAFAMLPREVQDTTITEIKSHFLKRKDNLVDIVERYYNSLMEFQMLTGTDKDDFFEIIRLPEGKTQIKAFRIKDGEKADVLFDRIFDGKLTKEIWLYGLDDKDFFEVSGEPDKAILIRIIGGQDKDTYTITEGKRIKVYDRRSKNNDITERGGAHFRFTNFYEANLYDYQKTKTKGGSFLFKTGYNPDVGTGLSVGYTKTVNRFIENPYGTKTEVLLNYTFLSQGLDLRFSKAYAAVILDYNLVGTGRYTSKNYTQNFFGFGNETINKEDSRTLDYNKVNMEMYNGGIGVERTSDYGSFFQLKFDVETIEIVRNGANLISEIQPSVFGERSYFGIPNATYRYKNYDDTNFPTKGMLFSTTVGAIDTFNSSSLTGFAKATLRFYNSVLFNNRLILKTEANTMLTTGDQPGFYHSPQLGAETGLRGYRNERFTGKHSLAGSADLIYNFRKLKTFIFPLEVSVFGGYDLGRVWIENDTSEIWHNSYGGGFIIQWTQMLQGNFSTFKSEEDTRIAFGLQVKL